MNLKTIITFICYCFISTILSATEFTIGTYNCGALSDNYDYLRGVTMQKLMQERYIAEPEKMAINEKIQKMALKILFAPDGSSAKELAQREWLST